MLVDTNVWLLVLRRGFPLEAEVQRQVEDARIAVPGTVLDELDRLVESKTLGAQAARALAGRFPVVSTSALGDRGILEAARRRRTYVVTADRALATRLVLQGTTVLVPRDRTRLELRAGMPPTPRRPRTSAREQL